MKKALVILLALTMVFGAFADPDVTVSVTEFKGEAEFGWKADLEAETTGMYNKDSASLKIQFIDKEATRSTEGEGLWGELVIKAGDKVELEAGNEAWTIPSVSVDTAKIHFVDGDTYVRLNILKPGFAVGGIDYVKATEANGDNDKFGGAEVLKGAGYNGFTLEAGIPMVDVEIAFGDNGADKKADAKEYGFKAAATVKPIDGLEIYGGVACASAEDDAAFAAKASYKLALNDTFYVKPIVSYAQKAKKQDLGLAVLFGWGADGLEPGFKKAADAGADKAWDVDSVLLALTNAQYSTALTSFDVDKIYEAAFKAEVDAFKTGSALTTSALQNFQVMTGADAAQVEKYAKKMIQAEYDEMKKEFDSVADFFKIAAADLSAYNVADKAADGITVVFGKDLGNDKDNGKLQVNAFDSTFVPGLKLGAKFYIDDLSNADKNVIAAAAKYGNDFGILTLDADLAFGLNNKKTSDNTAFSYGVKLSTDDVIANTTLFAQYDGQNASVEGKSSNGAITLGAKISF